MNKNQTIFLMQGAEKESHSKFPNTIWLLENYSLELTHASACLLQDNVVFLKKKIELILMLLLYQRSNKQILTYRWIGIDCVFLTNWWMV